MVYAYYATILLLRVVGCGFILSGVFQIIFYSYEMRKSDKQAARGGIPKDDVGRWDWSFVYKRIEENIKRGLLYIIAGVCLIKLNGLSTLTLIYSLIS